MAERILANRGCLFKIVKIEHHQLTVNGAILPVGESYITNDRLLSPL